MVAMSAALIAIPFVLSLLTGKELAPRYVPSAIVGIPILLTPLAALVRMRWLQWVPVALAAVVPGQVLTELQKQQPFTFDELDRLAAGLKESGETWASATKRLTSPSNWMIQSSLAAVMEHDSPDPEEASTLRLALMAEDAWSGHEPDPGWTFLPLGGGYVALHSRLDTWVDTTRFTLCLAPEHPRSPDAVPEKDWACGTTGLRRVNPAMAPHALLATQSFPELVNAASLLEAMNMGHASPVRVQQKLRVRRRGADESPSRHLQVMANECDGVIVSVDGLPYRGTLPAREIALLQPEPADGEITIACANGAIPEMFVSVPVLYETTPEESNIRAFLRKRRVIGFLLR